MVEREPGAGGRQVASGTAIPEEIPERFRERVAVRRRTGVLLLMALGLYYGLAQQETAPAGGAFHGQERLIAFAA
jgi:hypothetical protein